MPLISLIVFSNLLLIVLARFNDRNEPNDYKRNLMKKSNENAFPTEVLYRSQELEYVRYVEEQNVKGGEDSVSPDIMVDNWIEPSIFPVTDPDEQTVYLPMAMWGKNESDSNQKSEPMFKKNVILWTTKSPIQLLKHAATARTHLLNNEGLKKGPEWSAEPEQQPNMNGTFETQNITEVYEEPFIRIYVEPLCGGPDC
uniref:Uncharacterized protein n=1 Tax=Elaeophora elaphi TaxID=1147741 RepID=A0A0R3RRA6_9BILA